jgi:hypothetical protein
MGHVLGMVDSHHSASRGGDIHFDKVNCYKYYKSRRAWSEEEVNKFFVDPFESGVASNHVELDNLSIMKWRISPSTFFSAYSAYLQIFYGAGDES